MNHSDCILLNDEAFDLARKEAIINKLEDVMTYYTSRHNHIAYRQGITYTFRLAGSQEWHSILMMLVFLWCFRVIRMGPYGLHI